uniref:variable large family protein n=1 Tax=Borreliella bavariensis TaxID=664662 RepID=UPI001C005193
MHKAVDDTAKAGEGGNESIANVAGGGADAAGAQDAAEAAGKAVSAVSGDQILKAIVDAAGATEGKKADEAANAVEAAIGADDGAAGAAFGAGIGNKNDQIAAAIVLRGLAKGGKFANENDAANTKVVAAVKSAVESG